MTYLASPYSSYNVLLRNRRARASARVAAILFDRGEFAVPAIALGKSFNEYTKEQAEDWNTWSEYDKELIRCCDSVTVICMDGWKESIGVQAEIAFAKFIGKPVRFVDERGRALEGVE